MRLIGTWLLVAALASACAASPYDQYLAKHPEWTAEFPVLGAGLEETVAAIHAPPPRRAKNKLMAQHKVDISQTDADPWQRVPMVEVYSDASADYLVVVHSSCDYASDNYWHSHSSASWYFLVQGRLTSYGHWQRAELCGGELQLGGVDELPLPVRNHLERSGLLSSTLPTE